MEHPHRRTLRTITSAISLALSLSLLAGCAHMSVTRTTVVPWREADALFHQDPRWVGGDDAFSVDLGAGRTLWLFGDSFIDPTASHRRPGATMVRNSVALQEGYDPSAAKLSFYWRQDGVGVPTSFFPDRKDTWFWPGHGIRLGKVLLFFLMRVHKVDTGLGFEVEGWDAVMVDDPDQPPAAWRLTWLSVPKNDIGVIVGSASVLRKGRFLYAFGAREAVPSHPIYLVRWPAEKIQQGDMSALSWWDGQGFNSGDAHHAVPVFDDGQTELTIHRDRRSREFVGVQTMGFGPSPLGLRTSPRIQGPWSSPVPVYEPSERHKPGIMIYAGKAHPQLRGADLVLTYATNSLDFAKLVADSELYYPRFLRLTWKDR